ncbi:MAG TPA: XRE family transcriptional regulator [Lactobacillus sp.]|uniref:helix-turn-helix domain-containing protein n=1 Tax=Ligilactobacillus murinus TaxID=1622 RepID=UPI00096DEC97|nr:helix-turn-helix transcriptional regulator [Ligilactobacillus murinus]HAP22939.1 XRE family transcriptional regulator [Lactobacillus sp.]
MRQVMTKLKKLRKDKGLSQREVAERLGMSPSMLAMMEGGYRRGSDETKVKLAKFYNESVDSLFFEDFYHLK